MSNKPKRKSASKDPKTAPEDGTGAAEEAAAAIGELKDDLKKFAKADMSALGEQMEALQRDVAALAGALRKSAEAQVGGIGERLRSVAEQASDGLRISADDARQKGEEAAGDVEAMINHYPLTSMLIALGLGYLVGKVTHK